MRRLVWLLGAAALVAGIFLPTGLAAQDWLIFALCVFVGGFVASGLWVLFNSARGTRPVSAWKDYDEVKELLEAGFYQSRNVI